MKKTTIEKLNAGIQISNEELLALYKKLNKLSSTIKGCGKPFKPFENLCNQNLNRVKDYLTERDVVFFDLSSHREVGVAHKLFKYIKTNKKEEDIKKITILLESIKKASKELEDEFFSLSVYCDYLIKRISQTEEYN